MKDLRPALIVVNGEISIRLKNSDLAFTLYRNPAGGHIGDAAIGKSYARVSDVRLIRQHHDSYGFDPFYSRVDEAGDDINVVNHEIQHHIHIRPTLAVGREAMAFDETRRSQIRLRRQNGCIEALEMPHVVEQY